MKTIIFIMMMLYSAVGYSFGFKYNLFNPKFIGRGGTITYLDSNGQNSRSTAPYVNGYTVHTFLSSGTFSALSSNSSLVDYLIVAGGGGGGSSGANYAGGGGAGGFKTGSVIVYKGEYSIVVGNGGSPQNNGQDTIALGFTLKGGGAGSSSYHSAGAAGGSGGGGAPNNGAGGTGIPGQGNNGGYASAVNAGSDDSGAGGGGGAGGTGSEIGGGSARNSAGQGGAGVTSTLQTGIVQWYAAGGCGSGRYYCNPTSGIGGGTYGFIPSPPYTTPSSQQMTAGVNGTGSGGGGGRSSSGTAGGSGIVIIRYRN